MAWVPRAEDLSCPVLSRVVPRAGWPYTAVGQVKRLPGEDLIVDLDIDVFTLFNNLHKQALEMITPESDPQLLKRAKDLLQSMIDIAPQNPLPRYNLACAEALLGEAKEAVESLKLAIRTFPTCCRTPISAACIRSQSSVLWLRT